MVGVQLLPCIGLSQTSRDKMSKLCVELMRNNTDKTGFCCHLSIQSLFSSLQVFNPKDFGHSLQIPAGEDRAGGLLQVPESLCPEWGSNKKD